MRSVRCLGGRGITSHPISKGFTPAIATGKVPQLVYSGIGQGGGVYLGGAMGSRRSIPRRSIEDPREVDRLG